MKMNQNAWDKRMPLDTSHPGANAFQNQNEPQSDGGLEQHYGC